MRFSTIHRNLLMSLLSLGILCNTAFAQTSYVGDQLRVGVRAEPNNSTPSITVVTTGTPLTILERQGSHVKVRTPNGVEGWVRGAYLSTDKPGRTLYKEARKKITALERKLDTLSGQPNTQGEQDNVRAELARLHEEKSRLEEKLRNTGMAEVDVGGLPVDAAYVIFAFTIFFVCVGFLIGVTWHKSQVTKRLGGLSL